MSCNETETLQNLSDIPGVLKKYRRQINNRTNAFCLIFIIFTVLNKAYLKSDSETKIV